MGESGGWELTSLLSSGPEIASDFVGDGSTADLDGLSILGNLNAAQLVHVDLNTMVHLSQRGNGSVSSVESKKRQFLVIGIFDLPPSHQPS